MAVNWILIRVSVHVKASGREKVVRLVLIFCDFINRNKSKLLFMFYLYI